MLAHNTASYPSALQGHVALPMALVTLVRL